MKTNYTLHAAKSEKNGEIFISPAEVIKEMAHYIQFLKGKKVYIPNTKSVSEFAYNDAFVQFFSSKSNMKKFGIKELSYSYYDEFNNFVLITITENSITREMKDASDDESRLFYVFKQIDVVDVVIGNPEGNKMKNFFNYVSMSNKDYILSCNVSFIQLGCGYKSFVTNKTKFGFNKPSSFFNAQAGKPVKMGNMIWITSFDNGFNPKFIKTFYDTTCHTYEKYDNIDAINVDCIKMIPMDYEGVMGVPAYFAADLNLEQFEIVGILSAGVSDKYLHEVSKYVVSPCGIIGGKPTFARLLIRFRNH